MTENPITLLFRSRKFLLAVAGILIDALIAIVPTDFAPQFTAMRDELMTVVVLLFGAVIGGIAIEDHGEKSAPQTVNTGSGDVTVNPSSDSAPSASTPTKPYTGNSLHG